MGGDSVLVIGMARSGLAAVELLLRHGYEPLATDSRPLAELPQAARKLAELDVPFAQQSDALLEGRKLIVVSPGVPADLPMLAAARSRGIPVIGELELASRSLRGPIIGITGANGKTTTTALVGHILAGCGIPCQVGGNIGTPPASMVTTSRPDQWNVLELSSFQLETIRGFRAQIAAVLNVTPDHLDRHHTFEAYAAAKARIFENQRPDDFAILNADDPTCVAYGGIARGRVLWFSLTRPVPSGVWLADGQILCDGEFVMNAGDIPLRGLHNVENSMAAIAGARLAGAKLPDIAAAIRTFPGVEHRIEFVRTVDGVDYYNDSKATNVDATLKAIDAFPGGLWIILGGKDKGSDYVPLRGPLQQKARAALLIGAATDKIAGHLGEAVPLIRSGTIERAVETARREAQPGDTVLLAPACASFDQFDNYEHRGRVFKELVRRLE